MSQSAKIPRHIHPSYDYWTKLEQKFRATHIADAEHLNPFLIPSATEGADTPGQLLPRARLSYGIPLNSAWSGSVIGHVQGANRSYSWGATTSADEIQTATPPDGDAKLWYDDITADGTSLPNFINGTVMEWMLSSPGGFIVCDTNATAGLNGVTKLQVQELGLRPYARFIPWSAVEDFGRSKNGYTWLQFKETTHTRKPFSEANGPAQTENCVFYILDEVTGSTTVYRLDKDNALVDVIDMGVIQSPAGVPMLPIIPVKFGDHPKLPYLGQGLYLGTADIIIQLFNRLNEQQHRYRKGMFGLLQVASPSTENHQKITDQMNRASSVIFTGPEDKMLNVGANTDGISAGLEVIAALLTHFYMAVSQKTDENGGSATAQSGFSMVVDHQRSVKPLLTRVAEALDAIETNLLYIFAQLAGSYTLEQAGELKVVRDTNFRVEDESERILRILKAMVSVMEVPKVVQEQLVFQVLERTKLVDLNQVMDSGLTLREEMDAEYDAADTTPDPQGEANVDPVTGDIIPSTPPALPAAPVKKAAPRIKK
jgi:hypothetical protein